MCRLPDARRAPLTRLVVDSRRRQMIQFVKDSRAGRNHIGGLPAFRGPDGELVGTLDEDDGFRVEL